MNCFDWIILTLIKKIDGQRTTGGIYHLLTGKRSAQTIQDAYLFDCYEITGSFKDLNRNSFEGVLTDLSKKGLLKAGHDENTFYLTRAGERELHILSNKYKLPDGYNGGKYDWSGAAALLWERFSLLFQSLSFLAAGKKTFIPVTYRPETQRWVKQQFHGLNTSVEAINEKLYYELVHFLELLPEREASLFVSRLTSPGRTGKTYNQLTADFNDDPQYARLYFQSVLHRLLEIAKDPSRYPLMFSIINDLNPHQILTWSAKETNLFLKQGRTLEQIMESRGLKKSTIEDHVIELALYDPGFSYGQFICQSDAEAILQAADQLETKRLKLIKDKLGSEYTYFQIRLALTQKERT